MGVFNLRNAAIALVAGVGLAGCAYGPYGGLGVGLGYGNGYGSYGYDPYYSGYSPYGYGSYGYGSPYWGWNDGYYYPGTGYYVYDRYRRPYRWTDTQRNYWEQRRVRFNGTRRDRNQTAVVTQQWRDFSNPVQTQTETQTVRVRNSDRVRGRSSDTNQVRVRSADSDDQQTSRGRRNGHYKTKND